MTLTSIVMAAGAALTVASPLPFDSPPSIFAPGVISGPAHDSAPAFTPDDNTVYFGRSTATAAFILVSHKTGGAWSRPRIAKFSGQWMDMEPAMSPDGSYLIFASNRPRSPNGKPVDGAMGGKVQIGEGSNLWRVDRTARGWTTPTRLSDTINTSGSTYSPSIAGDGTLLFMRPNETTHRFQIFSAMLKAGIYSPPKALSFSDGSETDVDPAISRDQSFIVFGSGRHEKKDIDLYIAFRTADGWNQPLYLGDTINSPSSDAEPRLSPDNKTLYFASDRLAPAPHPIPRSESDRVLADMTQWNNGLYNIWTVNLAAVIQEIESHNLQSAGGKS